MKLVIISDTHGLHEKVKVPAGDVLIHCGDCTNDAGQRSLRDFLTWFERQPCPRKILIAGNHDWAFEKWPGLAQEMVMKVSHSTTYLQDSGCEIGGFKFYGTPYQPEFCNWAFNLPRGEALRKVWDKIPDDTDVLITHGPPKNRLDVSGFDGDRCGCVDLYEAVLRVRPRVHAFGHIHHGYGTKEEVHDDGFKTTFINASICDERYNPTRSPWIFEL